MWVDRPDGARLYVTARGDGPAVVLAHGALHDHRALAAVADRLVAAGRRVVTWDLRGHGRSSRGAATAFDALRDDVLAVLDVAGPGPVAVAGHELGGLCALAAATAAPGRVSALSVWAVDPQPGVLGRAAAAIADAARTMSMRPAVTILLPFWFHGAHRDDPLATLVTRTAITTSAGAVAAVLRGAADHPDLRPARTGWNGPVQALWGASDLLFRRSAAAAWAATAADAGPIPDAAHLVHVDRGDLVAERLLAFLDHHGA